MLSVSGGGGVYYFLEQEAGPGTEDEESASQPKVTGTKELDLEDTKE